MSKNNGKLRKFFNSRSLKYGSNSIIMIAAVIAIAVLVNVLADMAGVKLDLTKEGIYTLSKENITILKGLTKDVTIYGLFDDTKVDAKEVTEVLEQYRKYPHIKVEYIDPDRKPGTINELDPQGLNKLAKGDFVVKSGTKTKKVSSENMFYQDDGSNNQFGMAVRANMIEQAFTGAIKFVTADKTPTVYFLTGHGEKSVDSEYNDIKAYLGNNNYDIKSLSLTTEEKVPDETAILIIASPKQDLSVDEGKKIEAYLKNKGRLILLADSLESNTEFAQLEALLEKYNLGLNYDKVRENDDKMHLPQEPYDLIVGLEENEFNTAFNGQGFQMIMPKSRSIRILKNEKEWVKVTPLMKTSSQALGEQIDKSRGADIKGPLDLAVTSEVSNGEKILVMGNSFFMSDAAKDKYGPYYQYGMAFFLNSLNMMQNKKDEVSIPPKLYEQETLKISESQANSIFFVLVIVFPLLIMGLGMFVWMRRRHL